MALEEDRPVSEYARQVQEERDPPPSPIRFNHDASRWERLSEAGVWEHCNDPRVVQQIIEENERAAEDYARRNSPEYRHALAVARDREQWREMEARAAQKQGRAADSTWLDDPVTDPSLPCVFHRRNVPLF